jgi:hypothetical protein
VIERHGDGVQIAQLVDEIVHDLNAGIPVALGFECPIFVPISVDPNRLGKARAGEGNRSFSAGAGPGALVTGVGADDVDSPREFGNSLAAVMASARAVPRMEPCQAELAMQVAISRVFSPVVGEVAVAAPRNPGAR